MLKQAKETWPDNAAAQFCYLLERAFHLFETNFGNLQTFENWRSLYKHLSGIAINGRKLPSPPDSHLIHFTIILFQSRCPIRFAFLDGQARMVAVSHYIRGIVPGHPLSITPIEPIMPYLPSKGKGSWSASQTGSIGNFHLLLPMEWKVVKPIPKDTINSRANLLKSDLNTISRQRTYAYDIAEKSHFFHTVLELRSELETRNEFPTTVSELGVYMKNLKETIIKRIFHHLPLNPAEKVALELDQKDDSYTQLEAVMNFLGKEMVICPKMGARQEKIAETRILVVVLALLLAKQESRAILEEIFAMDWKKVYTKKSVINGFDINQFDKSTIICDEIGAKLFEQSLYQVRSTSNIVSSYGCRHTHLFCLAFVSKGH
jgi:hypothetical protein